jgi:hypothetical protein
VKRPITVLSVGSIVCSSAILLVLTAGDGLSKGDLKVGRRWDEIIPTDALKSPQQLQDELNISEAIVRFTIAEGYFEKPVCLTIYQKEPSDVFMKRLSNLAVAVNKASQIGPPGCGSILHVDWMLWISPKKVRVVGGNIFLMCAGLCPPMGVYDLVKTNTTWTVLRFAIWSDAGWYTVF